MVVDISLFRFSLRFRFFGKGECLLTCSGAGVVDVTLERIRFFSEGGEGWGV